MNFETIPLGQLETNAYVIWGEESAQAAVFDCPDEPGPLLHFLAKKKLNVTQVFLTHAHADHLAGLDELLQVFPGIPVYQHESERPWLTDPQLNLSSWMGSPVVLGTPTENLDDEQTILTPGGTLKVLHVPGHSPGSLLYFFEKEHLAIGGDLLFRGSVGRWDLPGSDPLHLKQSLDKVFQLPEETIVYPGHGPRTTIRAERTSNSYLR